MSPKETRSKRGELPKPIIRRGTLGFMPLNGLAVSCLAQNRGEVILGHHDRPETLALKAKPCVSLAVGRGKQEFSLEGRFFNGCADALYRGRLPEVVLVSVTGEDLANLLEDWVEYLEKLLALGFFLPRKEVIKRDPVTELVPCFVLSGNGMLFAAFVNGMMRSLRSFEQQYPVMNEALRLRIAGRFVRGLYPLPEDVEGPEPAPVETASGPYDLQPVPGLLRIAGGSAQTQEIVQSVLGLHGIVAGVENRVRNPVERIELEAVMGRLSRVILPALLEGLPVSEMGKLAARIEAGIQSIGRKRLAFDESEALPRINVQARPETPKGSGKKGKATPPSAGKGHPVRPRLHPGDVSLLTGFSQYAGSIGLSEEQRLFEELAGRVRESD